MSSLVHQGPLDQPWVFFHNYLVSIPKFIPIPSCLALPWWDSHHFFHAIAAWKWMNVKVVSCVQLFATHGLQSMEFSRPECWSGSLSLLQGIFPTQGSNPGLLHSRWILYQMNYKGSSRVQEWVACPFFRGYSWPRNQTRVSFIQADSLPTELLGKLNNSL